MLWDREVDDLELTHRPVAATRADHYGTERLDRDFLAIQFQVALSFHDEVDFGRLLMIMRLRFIRNFEIMHRSGCVLHVDKGPAGGATTALDWIEIAKLHFFKSLHDMDYV